MPHFAECTKRSVPLRDRFHAERPSWPHSCASSIAASTGNVPSRHLPSAQIEDLQAENRSATQIWLMAARPRRAKFFDHNLRRYRGRERRHALRGNAVIAGKDRPTSGRVTCGDRPWSRRRASRAISSSRPRDPDGLVSCASRSRATASAALSGPGKVAQKFAKIFERQTCWHSFFSPGTFWAHDARAGPV